MDSIPGARGGERCRTASSAYKLEVVFATLHVVERLEGVHQSRLVVC
jgi:hypothetical protein